MQIRFLVHTLNHYRVVYKNTIAPYWYEDKVNRIKLLFLFCTGPPGIRTGWSNNDKQIHIALDIRV